MRLFRTEPQPAIPAKIPAAMAKRFRELAEQSPGQFQEAPCFSTNAPKWKRSVHSALILS